MGGMGMFVGGTTVGPRASTGSCATRLTGEAMPQVLHQLQLQLAQLEAAFLLLLLYWNV